MRLAADHVRVTVPASAGNLGPGFDSLGMALGVFDQIEVRAIASEGVEIEVEGEGAGKVPTDESHLFVRAFRAALDEVDGPQTGLHIKANNSIPQSRGLGSSAATIVAAVTAARAMIADPDALSPEVTLRIATRIEGHPDNAAPAIYGGATVCWMGETGAHATALSVADGIETAVLIPRGVLPTVEARAALPTEVPHKHAAFNLSRAALLVHALAGRPELLFDATADMLHQDYRAPQMMASIEMMCTLRDKGLAAVVSGAGPSVLVIGESLANVGLATGDLAWADGVGDEKWRAVLTAGRVPGATAAPVTDAT